MLSSLERYIRKFKEIYGKEHLDYLLGLPIQHIESEDYIFGIDVQFEGIKKKLFVWYAIGDGRKIDKHLYLLAKLLQCKEIEFITKRNPEAFTRKFGYKIKGYLLSKEV